MTLAVSAIGWGLAAALAAGWFFERRRADGLRRAITAQDARWRNANRATKPWDLS